MRRAAHAACAVLAVFSGGAALAQNTNPDISVIGDVRAFVTDDATDPKEGDLQLDLTGAEVALQGYLNPFARADVFVGYHDDEFELEEAYATILRGLPGGLQLARRQVPRRLRQAQPAPPPRLLVPRHPAGAPGATRRRGPRSTSASTLNVQIPVGASALTISGNVLKGDFAEPHAHDHDGEAPAVEEETAETGIGYSERVSIYVPTGDYAGFEVGVNALQGVLDAATNREVELLGADLKYRWAPDKYRSLTVQGEWIRSHRDVASTEHEGGEEAEHASEVTRRRLLPVRRLSLRPALERRRHHRADRATPRRRA